MCLLPYYVHISDRDCKGVVSRPNKFYDVDLAVKYAKRRVQQAYQEGVSLEAIIIERKKPRKSPQDERKVATFYMNDEGELISILLG